MKLLVAGSKMDRFWTSRAMFKKFEGELRVGFGHPWSAELEIFEIFETKEAIEEQLSEDLKEHERRLSAT